MLPHGNPKLIQNVRGTDGRGRADSPRAPARSLLGPRPHAHVDTHGNSRRSLQTPSHYLVGWPGIAANAAVLQAIRGALAVAPKVRRPVFVVMFMGLSAGSLMPLWWALTEARLQFYQ